MKLRQWARQTHNWMSEDMEFTLERTRLFMRKKTGDEKKDRQRMESSRTGAMEKIWIGR